MRGGGLEDEGGGRRRIIVKKGERENEKAWEAVYTGLNFCTVLEHSFGGFFLRFYLFIFRERGTEGGRGRETSMYGCLS